MKNALALAALAMLAAPAAAYDHHQDGAEAAEPEQARIPFADRSIRNWRAPERDVLLIEANNGRWYRAEFFGPCRGLRFTEAIGFDTNFDGSFDRYSSVITRDQRCRVRSLVRIPDPDEEAEENSDEDESGAE
ncbi:hypothetical protein HFP57_09225 [Parasphingopyxis algicola]|uniref:DUF6491 family protein n=1 Tax=Parasphingopyxis algicola TaxID=2026624 RepID=UPI0015A1512B|nr:DUF6491 family protein [Parasphingopyxis algicola]QLC25186.1 hypothetical protein HFP57_09225 [Parasphingopyxis algicola]